MHMERTRKGKPNCPLTTYKCPRTGKILEQFGICDIPLEERHKYIDPEQDMNDPRMRTMGNYKIEIENPMEAHTNQIAVLSNHMIELTNQLNELTKKLKNMNP